MGWIQSAAVREDYEITSTVVDVDLIQRLALGNYFTTINFEDANIYLIFTISEAGEYFIRWSDLEEGDGTDTVNIEVRVYESDPVTGQPVTSSNLVPSQDGYDGYYGPLGIQLAPGDYYLYLVLDTYDPTTGTAKILVTE